MNFIDFSLQNVTVRHFLAFWKLFFYRGSFKHTVFTWVRASEGSKNDILFRRLWVSWRLLGRFGALLGPLLGLIFHFGLANFEELAKGGLKLLGLAEKSAA